jgi:hypothetical protein
MVTHPLVWIPSVDAQNMGLGIAWLAENSRRASRCLRYKVIGTVRSSALIAVVILFDLFHALQLQHGFMQVVIEYVQHSGHLDADGLTAMVDINQKSSLLFLGLLSTGVIVLVEEAEPIERIAQVLVLLAVLSEGKFT